MEPNGLKRITHRHTKLDHISANRLRSACVCVRVVLCRCGRHLLYQCFLLSCLVLFILLNENLALTMLTSDCAVSLTIMTMLIKVTLENLTHTFIVQHSVLLIHEASVVRITLHCFWAWWTRCANLHLSTQWCSTVQAAWTLQLYEHKLTYTHIHTCIHGHAYKITFKHLFRHMY